jgi:thymidylate synthase (FAD)
MQTINKSEVTLLGSMGNDLEVTNDARVSFNKKSEWDYEWVEEECPDGDNRMLLDHYQVRKLKPADSKLITYLAEHNHWAPFAHCYLKFRIKTPIFVARQLHKHQVGLAVSEVSRRYVNYTPEIYVPDVWREKAKNKKQGSGKASIQLDVDKLKQQDAYQEATDCAVGAYDKLLKQGVCEEQARMVLPVGSITEFIWSGSLAAFLRVCSLRNKEDAQEETREVAVEIEKVLRMLFPVATAAMLGEEVK